MPKIEKLTSHFYTKNSPECDQSSRFFKPAVAFERYNAITGIAGYWRFPERMNASQFENFAIKSFAQKILPKYGLPGETGNKIIPVGRIDNAFVNEMMSVWLELTKLNPGLKKVSFNACSASVLPIVIYDAVEGAASLLNASDINYLVRLRIETENFDVRSVLRTDPQYSGLYQQIEKKASYPVRWVPSPGTMKVIKSKLNNRKTFTIQPKPAAV